MVRLLLLAFIVGVIYLWWHHPQRFRRDFWHRWLVPGIVSFLALLYAGSPIDLIPDFTPIGFLDDIIILLSTFWWVRQRMEKIPIEPDRRREPKSNGPRKEVWDPYAVLGISRGASRDEVTRAYREQMKLYHPDRVAELGDELQRVAHQKAIDIQRAYKELS
jgi:uncharacterized membrane protein YkvA (DUF1232 family)